MGNSVCIKELSDFVATECKICKAINSHGYAYIKGYLTGDFTDSIKSTLSSGGMLTISALDDEDSQKDVFVGIVDSYDVVRQSGYDELSVKLVAATKLLDLQKKTAAFTNMGETYDNIIDYVCRKCGANFENNSLVTGNIGKISVQYQETDWEYLKRLVSEKNSFLVPDYEKNYCFLYIGMPSGETKYLDNIEYIEELNYVDYVLKNKNGITTFPENETSYIFTNRQFYALGTSISANGMYGVIYKCEMEMKGVDLQATYYVKKEAGLKTIPIKNYQIIGASILGEVKGVEGDKVQVEMQVPGRQSEPCKMEFATVYSSTGDSGWYCMPENNDLVRVYFPCEDENEAFVFNAMQVDKEEKEPGIKFFRNPQGKEIEFAPTYLKISNGNGLSITLDDEAGISIKNESGTAIEVVSDADIIMESTAGNIDISAKQKVALTRAATGIVLEKDVTISGEQVHVKEL